jgi:peptidoglycan/LPS O-acetylase OafA/YrhL
MSQILTRVEEEHLRHLDGLRALAVLAVVVYHAWGYAGCGGSPIVARAFQMTAHGVDLFFVLSGFCLSYPFLKRLHRDGSAEFSLINFATKRLTRIVPTYWLAIVTLTVLGAFHLLAPPPPITDLLKQALFLDRKVAFLSETFWTLPIEFRWYFLLPLILFAYVRMPRVVLIFAIGSYVLYNFSRLNDVPDFGTLPAFIAGIWAADIYITQSPIQKFAAPTFVLYGAMASIFEPSNDQQVYGVEPIAIIAVVAFVVMAGRFVFMRRLLGSRVLTAIGGSAYGIYLIHDPIERQLESAHHISPIIAAAVSISISMIFSWIAEKPFVSGTIRSSLNATIRERFDNLFVWMRLESSVTIHALPISDVDIGNHDVLRAEPEKMY